MSARWRTGLVVLGAALALAGCSSDGSGSTAAGAGSSESSATAAQKPAKEKPVAQEPAADEPQGSGVLEAFVAAQQSSIPAILDAGAGVYSDAAIEAVAPSTIVFSYVYAEAVDVPTAAAYLDTMVETLQAACDAQVFPAMVAVGISDPQVVYTYLNPDGSEIWTHTFAVS